jgi:hypothetical protein
LAVLLAAPSIPASGAQIEWRAEVTPGEALQLPCSKAASQFRGATLAGAAGLEACVHAADRTAAIPRRHRREQLRRAPIRRTDE